MSDTLRTVLRGALPLAVLLGAFGIGAGIRSMAESTAAEVPPPAPVSVDVVTVTSAERDLGAARAHGANAGGALLPSLSQAVIAIDVGLWRCLQCQCVRRIDFGVIRWSAVDQSVQQVQNVHLGGHACFQRQFHRTQHIRLLVLENQ